MNATTECTDDQLFIAYREGQKDAFTVLHMRHQVRLHTFLKRSYKLDDATADDVSQAVWIRLHEARDQFVQNFRRWLRSTAGRLALDHKLKAKRERTKKLPQTQADCLADFLPGVMLSEILTRLSDAERRFLCLIYCDGYSICEAASEAFASCASPRRRLSEVLKLVRA